MTETKVNVGYRCELVKQYKMDLQWEWNNLVVNPPNQPDKYVQMYSTYQVNSKSLLWAGKHILHPFYPYSIFYPHTGGMANLQHSAKKQ